MRKLKCKEKVKTYFEKMQKLMYKKCKKEKQCEKYENYYEKHSEN
jgi:hypothetical protein